MKIMCSSEYTEREREKAQAFTTKRFVIINVTKHEVHNKYHGISGEKF